MTENQTDRRTGAERRANARPEYDRRAFLRRMADLDDQIRAATPSRSERIRRMSADLAARGVVVPS